MNSSEPHQQCPLKDKERGFLHYRRRDLPHRPVEERLKDFRAVELPPEPDNVRCQAARCMDCGVPFCHSAAGGCPLSNVMPEFNDFVYSGKWREALDILLSTNRFPEFTGRICPAPCESACVLGINDDPVTIRQIELAIIEQGWENGWITPEPPQRRREKKIAVLGSGPAGLACADMLNRAGFGVAVFETDRRPGGILRYGIPDFKLEKWVIDRRIELMRAEGIVFECDVEAGEDISQRYLSTRFNAIVIAGGAREPRDLTVPGRELKGIHQAMDFLTQQNRRIAGEPIAAQPLSAEGLHVVVIGGGDTGSDCIGTANRQGALSVTQLEILPEPPPLRAADTPWPLWPRKLRTSSSHEEGATRRWSVSTEAFSGDNAGHVSGLDCVEVEWIRGPGGRLKPEVKENSRFHIEAGLVLLAMGFTGPGGGTLIEQFDIERDERGFILRDSNWMTSSPGIFVCGDMTRGASLVVHAIADGMRCAENVEAFLEGKRQK